MNPDLDWERRYRARDTPWDQGAPAPALAAYLENEPIRGRILVPGCGRGHDARWLATQADANVVGLDLSPTACAAAESLVRPSEINGTLRFVTGDFLNLPAEYQDSFDWLVEHTCFCALEPRNRVAYVQAAAAVLRPGGKIFGIFFIQPDVVEGPPFAVSYAELIELFKDKFDLLAAWIPRESYPDRAGREQVRILRKC